jgi:hypothetical protein
VNRKERIKQKQRDVQTNSEARKKRMIKKNGKEEARREIEKS